MPKTVLVLAPHPDDAEYYAGGTLTQMIAAGDRVLIAITTDGSKGSFEHPAAELAKLRQAEAQNAAKVLGAEPPIFLGYVDLELDMLPPGTLRERYVRLIRQYRPDVVIAEDCFANGEDHPDHRTVAWAASDAIRYALLPNLYPEQLKEGLKTFVVTEKYFYSEDPKQFNKVVDITNTFDQKMAALLEHKTQINFMVQEILDQAQQAGLDVKAALGDIAGDRAALMMLGMRMMAADMGATRGIELGEGFRYERYHPLVESFLS
ncbi:MAG TPA: PIG-L deacetylase family protein [Longilinea sp.]|nr:PIG-L deacetylase family protein [Longilinea sp.]